MSGKAQLVEMTWDNWGERPTPTSSHLVHLSSGCWLAYSMIMYTGLELANTRVRIEIPFKHSPL